MSDRLLPSTPEPSKAARMELLVGALRQSVTDRQREWFIELQSLWTEQARQDYAERNRLSARLEAAEQRALTAEVKSAIDVKVIEQLRQMLASQPSVAQLARALCRVFEPDPMQRELDKLTPSATHYWGDRAERVRALLAV